MSTLGPYLGAMRPSSPLPETLLERIEGGWRGLLYRGFLATLCYTGLWLVGLSRILESWSPPFATVTIAVVGCRFWAQIPAIVLDSWISYNPSMGPDFLDRDLRYGQLLCRWLVHHGDGVGLKGFLIGGPCWGTKGSTLDYTP